MMRILVNHLTRMSPGFICVAGIDQRTQEHVRPVLAARQLTRSLLKSEGGPMCLGVSVEIGPAVHRPLAPEVEDHVFNPDTTRAVAQVDPADFWNSNAAVATSRLRDIFGPALEVQGARPTGALPRGVGDRSLGCLKLGRGSKLTLRQRGDRWAIRLEFDDSDLGRIAPQVTDLRFWQADQTTLRHDRVDRISRLLEGSILSVGLSRPFRPTGYDHEWHWLQVNNIHPVTDPLWEVE